LARDCGPGRIRRNRGRRLAIFSHAFVYCRLGAGKQSELALASFRLQSRAFGCCAEPPTGAEETFCSFSDAEAVQTVKLGLSYLFDTGPIYYRYLIGFE
jgi:hypothetical protein